MASDPEGPRGGEPKAGAAGRDAPSPVARLAAVLAAAAGADASPDAGPTSRELAELLWLAGQLGPPGQKDPDTGDAPLSPAAAIDVEPQPPPSPPAPEPETDPDPSDDDGRVPLHLPSPPAAPADDHQGDRGGGGAPLLAPAPAMLLHPLALQRALRPLKRRVPSATGRVLDERATVDRIARLGAHPSVWLPVLRPARDRWLRLDLVYDAGPTMPVWRPLVRELHTVLAQSGIFRTVALHRAGPDGRVRHLPAPADGRSVTLIVSDCMGPQWRPGPAGERWYRTLRHWAAHMPLAVVQPLPEHLWHTTALPAEPGLFTTPAAAAPTTALAFTPYDPDTPPPPPAAVPLPVLEPGPAWLANWAALLAAPGGGRLPGAAAWLTPTPVPPPEPAPDIASLAPEDLVLRFRATASPEAFRLAGHLALAVPSLPVMRLVQRVLEPHPRPQHLAEIILSGMLTTVPGPPGSYGFRGGVRELLLRSLPRSARGRTRELLVRIGKLIDDRAGLTAGEFQAETRGRGDAAQAFATVSEETVERLGGGGEERSELIGGRYRLVGPRGPGRRMWEAVDEETERPVVVHLYPEQAAVQERFLREAGVLAEVRDPHVVPVLDFGFEGETPYLVSEFVHGVTLAELLQGSGPGVSLRMFARLACQGVAGLEALHSRGLVRGQAGGVGLLLRPDGTVLISRFALGDESRGRDASTDLNDFGLLLKELARRITTAPPPYQEALTLIDHHPEAARYAAMQFAGADIASHITFRLLGPLRIWHRDKPLPDLSPASKALLSMLLLRNGRRVTFTELMRGIWEDPAPERRAIAHIHELASELGDFLGPGTLAALPDGYALHTADAYVDVVECEELASGHAPGLDPAARRNRVETALNLWRGVPLDDIPGPAAKAARVDLRTLRLTVRATRSELDLELGDFGRAAADLSALLREHPDHAEFRRLHMLALKGLGNITAAIESYEAYEERCRRQRSDPNPTLLELYRELRAAPERDRSTIVFEADGLSEQPEARFTLRREVTRLLTRGDLAADQYEILTRDNGFAIVTEPDADVLPVLVAVLRGFRTALAGLDDPPRFRVTFWHTPWFADADHPVEQPEARAALDRTPGDILVVVSPAVYERFANSSAFDDSTARFQALRASSSGSAPVVWYCPLYLSTPPQQPEPEDRDLVRGPFTTNNVAGLTAPDAGTAIVHTQTDGPLTLLNPARPYGKRPPRLTTYYEVDVTTHQASHEVSLPSSRGRAFVSSVDLAWHVDDPVAFVRSEVTRVSEVLLDHLLKEAARITHRYPLARGGAAQRAVRDGLRSWPVPGLSVSCSVRLTPVDPPPAPQRTAAPGPRPLRDLLAGAETVLVGFDGPLTTLFSAQKAREAALELLSLVAEHRDPEDALAGRPLTGADGDPTAGQSELVHPLAVLRAFAHSPLGPLLRSRLDQLELQAARIAHSPRHATALIHALHDSGRRVSVVTDVSEPAAERYLDPLRLPLASVHGRGDDLARLMPHPDCLLRALRSPGLPAPTGAVIASSVAEMTAARQLGLRFIGYASAPTANRLLREAGCDVTVSSLEPVLNAARSL